MHANARLSYWGRQELVRRVEAGTPPATVARQMNVSRDTVYKWVGRAAQADPDGRWWVDRSSRPHCSPTKTGPKLERKILSLRRNNKLGPGRIAGRLELASSTVHAVLARHGVSRLAWMDRPTGRVIRRYEHEHPGDLVHVDIKKLGKIPPGGGWWAHGRATPNQQPKRRARLGYCFVHSAVDDHSRLAYSEIHDDEQASTAAEFWRRARAFFADHGIAVRAVLTDNGPCYRSNQWLQQIVAGGATLRFTRPYRPQTNGKVERFNRTLTDEWAYARKYTSEAQRRRRLDTWLHLYNHHRCHTALGGQPPITRVDNLSGTYN